MRLISVRNLVAGVVVYVLLAYGVFVALSIIPNALSLVDDSLTETDFRNRYLLLGASAYVVSFFGWLLWEVLGRKFFIKNMFNSRFHMSTVWLVYVFILFVITVLLSTPVFKLISFASNYGPSLVSVLFYPISAIGAFWAATAVCSPSPFKYAAPLSRLVRKYTDRFVCERPVRNEV